MGMYTGLRFKAVIKEKYCEPIKDMIENQLSWEDIVNKYPEFSFAKKYSEYNRADFIPYGSLAYMPDEWESEKGKLEFERRFDETTRMLIFQCSLKNYEYTIEKFLKEIVTVIVEDVVHIEYYYEEDKYGYLYTLKDGKVVETGEKIDYKHWMNDEYLW